MCCVIFRSAFWTITRIGIKCVWSTKLVLHLKIFFWRLACRRAGPCYSREVGHLPESWGAGKRLSWFVWVWVAGRDWAYTTSSCSAAYWATEGQGIQFVFNYMLKLYCSFYKFRIKNISFYPLLGVWRLCLLLLCFSHTKACRLCALLPCFSLSSYGCGHD